MADGSDNATVPVQISVQDVNFHVSQRIRQRRIILGLSQQQVAEVLGVTYQQAHKYETGVSRVSSGLLAKLARALSVEVDYFFEGLAGEDQSEADQIDIDRQKRLFLELSRNLSSITRRKHQEAICQVARNLASAKNDPLESDENGPPSLVLAGNQNCSLP